jgi:flagellar basal-body rod protein FlgF
MKPDPMGTVMGAMRFLERKQEAISHNLANASTRGFKGERIFAQVIQGLDGPVIRGNTDLRGGGLTQTGGDLDVALDGAGFLVVESERGTRLTRGGSFSLNEAGQLVDETGARVLGQGGDIVLPPGKVEIGIDGKITVDGEAIDTLRIEAASPTALRREDGVYFVPEPGDRTNPRIDPQIDVTIRQGHLEESNVNPVDSMVEMIGVLRTYGMLQRSVQSLDQVSRTITNDLARVE